MDKKETNEQHWKLLVLMLRKTYEGKGITQEDIANRTGLKASNVSRFFNMENSPNLRTFITIAQSVGVNFFFEDKEGTTELNLIFEAAMTELGRRPDSLPKN